jgi:hypothetical protein
MSSRALFYLMVLVFIIGSIALFLGASVESSFVTILGFVGWIAAAGLLVYWLMGKRTAIE